MSVTREEKLKQQQKDWHIANKPRRNAERRARYQLNKTRELELSKLYYRSKHPETVKKPKQTRDEYNAGRCAYQEANREACRQRSRASYAKKKKYYLFKWTMRNAAKLERTPKWLTKEQRRQIQNWVENTPTGHDLDHIVPLQGKNVSGLNVPWNLQYLPMKENRQKRNKHDSD